MHAVLLLLALAAPRQTMLLFDLPWVAPQELQRARRAAVEMVERAGADETFGVAMYSSFGGVKVLVPFTRDRAEVLRAIDALRSTDDERMANPEIVMMQRSREVGRLAEGLAAEPGEKHVAWIVPRHGETWYGVTAAYPRTFERGTVYSWTHQPGLAARRMAKQFADAGVTLDVVGIPPQ